MVHSLESKFLLLNGFVKLNNVVKLDKTEDITREMDYILDKSGGPPKSRSDAKVWINKKSSLQRKEEIRNLIQDEKIKYYLSFFFL